MDRLTRLATALAAGVVIVSALFAAGCASTWRSMHEPSGGAFYVGPPHVLSRERVLPERDRELQWLTEQLEHMPNDIEFQGFNEQRLTQSFMLGISAQVDPLGGALTDLQKKFASNDLWRAESLKQKENELQTLKYRLIIQGYTNGTDQLTRSDQPQPSSPTTYDDTALNAKMAELDKSLAEVRADLKEITNKLATLGLSADWSHPAQTKAKLTAGETIKDKVAYREYLNSLRRRKMLDESHDVAGQMLYELTFNVSFVPPKDESRYAVVRVTANSIPYADSSTAQVIMNELAASIFSEYLTLRSDLANGVQPEDPRFLLQAVGDPSALAALTNKYPATPKPARGSSIDMFNSSRKQIKTILPGISETNGGSLDPGLPGADILAELAAKHIKKKYNVLKEKEIITIEDASPGGIVVSPTQNTAKLLELIKELPSTNATRVLAVEPREYAQNVSDVAARQTSLSLALNLQAMLSQGVSGKVDTEYLRESLGKLEAITRTPLALGFNYGSSEFGWVLGPKFKIEDEKVEYEHTPVDHTLNVSLALPAWAPHVSFTVTTAWLDADGREVATGAPLHTGAMLDPKPSAVREALVQSTYGDDRYPRISPDTNRLQIRSGLAGQELLIIGQNLWRSPLVFLGNLKASHVDILPSMAGLHARFDQAIPLPSSRQMDLRVVTSRGSVVLPDGVRILPPSGNEAMPFASLKDRAVVWNWNTASYQLNLAVDYALIPPFTPQLTGDCYPEEMPRANSNASCNLEKGRLTCLLNPNADMLASQNSAIFNLDVMAKSSGQGQALASILTGDKTMIVFKSEEARRLRLENTNLTLSSQAPNAAIHLGLPSATKLEHLLASSPWLDGNEKEFKLILNCNGPEVALGSPAKNANPWRLSFPITNATLYDLGLPFGTIKEIKATLRSGGQEMEITGKLSATLEKK
jgi:hypothetical protein